VVGRERFERSTIALKVLFTTFEPAPLLSFSPFA